jgi:hypothetical protein
MKSAGETPAVPGRCAILAQTSRIEGTIVESAFIRCVPIAQLRREFNAFLSIKRTARKLA